MSAFDRQLTVTASTKRSPGVSNGKRGEPVTHLATLKCSPLDPVSADIAKRVALQTPHEVLQSFIGGDDVREGDILTVAGKDYPIRSVEDWSNFRGVTFRVMVLEELKR
jgi:hypothetical protein